jgi:hypothetical protein
MEITGCTDETLLKTLADDCTTQLVSSLINAVDTDHAADNGYREPPVTARLAINAGALGTTLLR